MPSAYYLTGQIWPDDQPSFGYRIFLYQGTVSLDIVASILPETKAHFGHTRECCQPPPVFKKNNRTTNFFGHCFTLQTVINKIAADLTLPYEILRFLKKHVATFVLFGISDERDDHLAAINAIWEYHQYLQNTFQDQKTERQTQE